MADESYDALSIAMSFDKRDDEAWRLLAEVGLVSIYVLGTPVRGFVISKDLPGSRECIRLDLEGRELVKAVAPTNLPRNRIDALVDRVMPLLNAQDRHAVRR